MDPFYLRNRPAVSPEDLARIIPLGDLLALGTQIHAGISPEALLQEVVETIHRVMRSPLVYVRLRNTDTDELEAVAFAGLDEQGRDRLVQTRLSPTFYQALMQPRYALGDSFLVPASVQPGCEPEMTLSSAGEPRDTLLVPLRGRGERLLGVIYVAAPEVPQSFSQANVHVLEAIARQAALALENVRLADRSTRLLAKEQLLAALGRDVSATLDLKMILERTVARLEAAFQSGSVALFDAAGNLETVAPERALPRDELRQASQGAGIPGWVADQRLAFFSNDIYAEPARLPAGWSHEELAYFFNLEAGQELRACVAVPLWSGGQVIGTLNVASASPGAFSYDEVDLLEAIAAQVGGPITSARLYAELQHLAAQVQHRAEQLTVLNALARTANASLDMKLSLSEVTTQIQRGFGYSHVELFLVDEEASELVLTAMAGRDEPDMLGYRQPLGIGVVGRAARTGKTQRVDDVREDNDYLLRTERQDTRSELCVPIIASGRVLGLLNLEAHEVAAFTSEDMAVLETSADVLASAIENARLYHRAQAAAVLEERNRLARELHDSVTQQLFSMTLTSQAARAHLEKNPQRAAQQLERLQETASAALAEMRALIFQLRPPALREQGLVAALQQHIGALSRREGLRIELGVTGDERYARGIEQPLYRIVQEALNNVVKHAQASAVRVMLEFVPEHVRVRVIDDGSGFDVEEIALGVREGGASDGRHLGLISMRERAAEVGGTMELRSARGGGTEVIVTVPRSGGRER